MPLIALVHPHLGPLTPHGLTVGTRKGCTTAWFQHSGGRCVVHPLSTSHEAAQRGGGEVKLLERLTHLLWPFFFLEMHATMTQLRLINDRSGPNFLASSRCFTFPCHHASHLPSGGSGLHLQPLGYGHGMSRSLSQTKSLAALAGSNAASRTSQRLSRHGSDRHKKPGPAWTMMGGGSPSRRMAAQIYNNYLATYSAKGAMRYPFPLSCQAEAMSSLDLPPPEAHGSLCPPVVLQSSPSPCVSFHLALVLL